MKKKLITFVAFQMYSLRQSQITSLPPTQSIFSIFLEVEGDQGGGGEEKAHIGYLVAFQPRTVTYEVAAYFSKSLLEISSWL